MPLNLASPGIVVKEVDLTIGRVDPTAEGIGAIVGPFEKGPVNEPVLINSEQELLNTFGSPYATDNHYETWLVASSYLAYGGSLQVVRSDDTDLKNAFAGSGSAPKIRSYEDYVNLGYDENVIPGLTVAAKYPGSWGNGMKVAIIDGLADQILSGFSGLDGLGTGVAVGMGITQSMIGRTKIGAGTTEALDGYLKGIITEASATQISVKVVEHISASGTATVIDYQPGGTYAFAKDGALGIHTAGQAVAFASTTGTTQQDWFDNQTISVNSNTTVSWSTLADRPGTSTYAEDKGARHDEVHVVVFDADGDVTGNAGTILEKHIALSKASDATYSAGATSYWRKYSAESSEYIFAGGAPAGITTTGFTSGSFTKASDIGWDQSASGIQFGATGNQLLTLAGGLNYDGTADLDATGSLAASTGDLAAGYDLFLNNDDYDINFVLMGGAGYERTSAQALASKVINIADTRKDCVAFVSPCRSELLTTSGSGYTVKSAADITQNVLNFYAPIPSSSYGVMDSGYKYMYDRFADTFRYVPLNGDIAGMCARNDATNFPWFSPAGTARGAVLNAVKLAYNPSQTQRDRLYSARINPVIFTPGGGITLFGDKTALNKSSAFDRINVRRLFIYLEEAIKGAARDVMFEFNDPLTRSSFVNAVEPFLRDVQAKRGIQEFRLICDESNNTAAVIDSNEFVADIFVKPSRSINFVGLTFVATRTGVSFAEVIGNV
tara:strand:+ start:9405 stop:11576 length:2172 start_codon:yes stop_codon:yes gene_type:complete